MKGELAVPFDISLLKDLARFVPSTTGLLDACRKTPKEKNPIDCFQFNKPTIPVYRSQKQPPEEERKRDAELADDIIARGMGNSLEGDSLVTQIAQHDERLQKLIADSSLSSKYVPQLLSRVETSQSDFAMTVLTWLAPYMSSEQAISTGQALLSLTKASGVCFYRGAFVRVADI